MLAIEGPMRAGEAEPVFRIWLDPDTHVVRIEGHHHWSIDDAHAFMAAATIVVEKVRACYGSVLMMIDLLGIPVHSQDVAELVAEGNSRMHSGDRMAFLVKSSLMKAQIRRITTHPSTACFLSADAAMTWLTAYAQRSVA